MDTHRVFLRGGEAGHVGTGGDVVQVLLQIRNRSVDGHLHRAIVHKKSILISIKVVKRIQMPEK